MSLINCTECNKEISSSAESCPNCGHPLTASATRVRPVVTSTTGNEQQIPKWVIPVVAVAAVLALFAFIYVLQNPAEPDEGEIRLKTAVETNPNSGDRIDGAPASTTTIDSDPATVEMTVPENDQTISADTKTRVADVDPDKGSVEIKARVADTKGDILPVNAEKFYLLDKDLTEILNESKLKPIQNNSLVNSFGLSVMYPDRFADFNERALSAINDHIKYDTLTDSKGTAKITNIRPNEYFIFAIHKVGKGFAIWSSPVLIKPGTNNLNIQPQRPIELAVRGG